ncbi:MAG: multiheme c-type cytochrome [Pyrodictiaceae archaeon]
MLSPQLRVLLATTILVIVILPAMNTVLARAMTYQWGVETPITVSLTSASKACISCHKAATPFIVEDWKKSRHYQVGVGCYECHGAAEFVGKRPDVENHFGYYITLVVTPTQCARCHPAQVEEFEHSVHAFGGLHAYQLKEYPAYWTICAEQFDWGSSPKYRKTPVTTVPPEYIETDWVPKIVRDFVGDQHYGRKVLEEDPTKAYMPFNPLGLSIENYDMVKALTIWGIRGCLQCHGARLDVKSAYAYPSLDQLEEMMKAGKLPEKIIFDPAHITNHGIGRVNPDGSLGSCEACHPYHGFSVKIARKGAYQACGRCHTGPDHPNDEQWSKSVHGAIFWGEAEDWNWDARVNDWRPGRDFRAPTCVTCHMAAVFDNTGKVKYASSHDVAIISKFKLGRWRVTLPRVPGLPDPAIPGATAEKAPVWSRYITKITLVYPEPDWKTRRQRAIDMCSQCHTKEYAASWLKTYDWMIILVDYMRDKYVVTVESMLKEKGLFTPMDKWKVRNLGAMANRPTKMSAAHFGPDYVWWEGIMHFTEWIEEWLIDVAERPAVHAKAPEIIEYINKEILPWYKSLIEGKSSPAHATVLFQKLAAEAKKTSFESLSSIAKPTVASVKPSITKYGSMEIKVSKPNSSDFTSMTLASLLLLLPASESLLVLRRRGEESG